MTDWLMGETVGKTDCGVSMGDATITVLDFADDIVIFAEMLEVLVHIQDILSTESEPPPARRTYLLCWNFLLSL